MRKIHLLQGKHRLAVLSHPKMSHHVKGKNHKILLENENVRVLQVTLKPGEVEPLHHHQWHSVLYIQSAGDFVDRDGAGNVIFDSCTLKTPLKFP